MARYRKIDVRIWNDKKFRALSDNGKLAFLLVLTHPDTTQLGMLRARAESLAMELGWKVDAMSDAMSEASRMGMLMVDAKAGLIVAPNFLKYNPPNGPNAMASWGEVVDLMPECALRSKALMIVKAFIDGLSDGMRKGAPDALLDAIKDAMSDADSMASGIQEQEQEQEYITTSDEVVREKTSDELFSTPVSPKEKPLKQQNCPTQEIVAAYNEKLGPYLGAVRKMTAARMSAVRARWLDVIGIVESNDKAECLKGMNDYFDKIARSDFLMGRVPGKTWKASFDFIFSAAGFTKIFEGKYENGR